MAQHLTISLEIARQLSEAGWLQNKSYFVWIRHPYDLTWDCFRRQPGDAVYEHCYAAYTAGELIRMLGTGFDGLSRLVDGSYAATGRGEGGVADTPEEALGLLMLAQSR